MSKTREALESAKAFAWSLQSVTDNGVIADQCLDLLTTLEAALAEPEQEPVIRGADLLLKWRGGYPPHPWSTERFLAKVKHGDDIRVVALAPLPEEYAYDCTTDEGTYYMKFRVLAWMQMPTSQFISPDDEPLPQPLKAKLTADALENIAAYLGIGGFNGATSDQLEARIKAEFDRVKPREWQELSETEIIAFCERWKLESFYVQHELCGNGVAMADEISAALRAKNEVKV